MPFRTPQPVKIDRLVRSRRKTLELEITPAGELVVRAPLGVSQAQIEAAVSRKAAWIRRKQAVARQAGPAAPVHRFAAGESFLYLGQAYRLAFSAAGSPALTLKDEFFWLSPQGCERPREAFSAWYVQQARRVFAERVAYYARRMGVSPKQVRISSARTRWGSCSTTGNLNLVWRLVMAPLSIVDYVVVHELAHLRQHNHSRAFWAEVEAIMPDYRQRRLWLKQNGAQLGV